MSVDNSEWELNYIVENITVLWLVDSIYVTAISQGVEEAFSIYAHPTEIPLPDITTPQHEAHYRCDQLISVVKSTLN